jgi:hypothetical protein
VGFGARKTKFKPHRLHRLRKKCFLVIPSEARDLLFFAKPKKKQIPRTNPALRNDSLRVFPQPLKPVLLACAPELQELRKFYDEGQLVEPTLAICMANFTNRFKEAMENIPDLGVWNDFVGAGS